jgi:D-alanyl-lipoteichoic acid biosynthesis protein DltB
MQFYNSVSFFVIALSLIAVWNLLQKIPFQQILIKNLSLFAINVFFLYNLSGFHDFQLVFILILAGFAFSAARLIIFLKKKEAWVRTAAGGLSLLAVFILIASLCVFKYQVIADLVIAVYPSKYLFDEGDLSRSLFRFIGISYAIFKMLQIVIDANRGFIRNLSLLSVFNFICFFPVFLSGPILRYNDFEQNLQNLNPRRAAEYVPSGAYRIASGVIKTLLISPFLYEISISNIPDPLIAQMVWYKALLVMYAYGFYIYFDFSGYCDLAIGLSSLMGFKVPENFNNPFFSRNIQEFWNRWHITLSQWLRDYFYYPFLKWQMKMSKIRNIALPAFAIFLTFLVMGLWHGITLTNLYYGIYHGAGLAFFMVFNDKIKLTKFGSWAKDSRIWKFCAIAITFHFYFFSFLIFCGKAGPFFKALIGV